MRTPLLALILTAASLTASPFRESKLDTGKGLQYGGGLSATGQLGATRNPGKQPVKIKPRVTATKIGQTPAAYLGKPLIVSARPTGIKRHQTGWTGKHAGLTVYLSDEAKNYYISSNKARVEAVFTGTVRKDNTGKPALYLSKGINYAK